MYNPELKEAFLSTYEESTRKEYSYVFIYSKFLEIRYGKDLKDFDKHQIEELLKRAKKPNLNGVRSFASKIKRYIDWAMAHSYTQSNLNPVSLFTVQEYNRCIDSSRKLYISEDDLIDIEEQLKNYQDKAIFRLLFEGVMGENLSELLNLKSSDVYPEENKLRLYDSEGRERFITVSDRCIEITKGAINETRYCTYTKTNRIYDLVIGEHVIRNTKNVRTKSINSNMTIHSRFETLKNFIGMPDLTMKNVWRSGMIKRVLDLLDNSNEITNDHLAEVAYIYGLQKIMNNGHLNYNFSSLREFINSKNIYDLYGIDIEVTRNSRARKLGREDIRFVKEIPMSVRVNVIYEFLSKGTLNTHLEEKKARALLHFYGLNPNDKARYPHVTLEEVKEKLQELNENELEEFYLANEEQIEKIYPNIITSEHDGGDLFRVLKTRQGQYKLRKKLLENYQSQCAMCQISHKQLLVASHIKPWADSTPEERMNPGNAILLCKLHDALFENGLISLSDDYRVLLYSNFDFVGQGIQTNLRFRKPLHDSPSPIFLKEHRQKHGYE